MFCAVLGFERRGTRFISEASIRLDTTLLSSSPFVHYNHKNKNNHASNSRGGILSRLHHWVSFLSMPIKHHHYTHIHPPPNPQARAPFFPITPMPSHIKTYSRPIHRIHHAQPQGYFLAHSQKYPISPVLVVCLISINSKFPHASWPHMQHRSVLP